MQYFIIYSMFINVLLISIEYHFVRHPDYRERNNFADICDYLSVPDDSLLHWATQNKRISTEAMRLGAELHHGTVLYPDLQRRYRRDDDDD